MVIKILTKLESRLEKLGENFNKELEKIIKNQSENTISAMKNALEGINSISDNTKE